MTVWHSVAQEEAIDEREWREERRCLLLYVIGRLGLGCCLGLGTLYVLYVALTL